MHACTHARMHARTHARTHAHAHTHMYIHTYAHSFALFLTLASTCILRNVSLYVADLGQRGQTGVRAPQYIYVYMMYIYIYIYIYMYIHILAHIYIYVYWQIWGNAARREFARHRAAGGCGESRQQGAFCFCSISLSLYTHIRTHLSSLSLCTHIRTHLSSLSLCTHIRTHLSSISLSFSWFATYLVQGLYRQQGVSICVCKVFLSYGVSKVFL